MRNIGDLSARNMRCASAVSAIAAGTLNEASGGFRTPGYRCGVVSQSAVRSPGHPPMPTGQTIRCTSASRAFRFSWAT